MLFDQICTIGDVDRLKQIVDILSNSLYKSDGWDKVVQTQVPAVWAEYFDLPNTERKEFLATVSNWLQQARTLRLRVAVDLPRASLERICDWARANLSPDIVLDIAVDPRLIAGAQISWGGKYVDLSYANRF